MIDSRRGRQRRRQLASAGRTAVWARRQNNAARLHVLRSNWRSFAALLIVAGAIVAGVAILIRSGFLRGLFVGVGASIPVAMAAYLVLAMSGTVATAFGATAETWTVTELRRLRKHGWLIVNGLPLEHRDVDHVLLGPAGVIVIESKWSAAGWRIDPPDAAVRGAIEQVTANARTLRLWHEVKSTGAPVRTAVMLWGGTRTGSPSPPAAPVPADDGPTIAYGLTAVRRWVDSLTADTQAAVMTEADTEKLWRALDRVVAAREGVDKAAAPPVSIDEVVWVAAAALVAFAGTALASMELLTATRSWVIWAAGSLVLLGAGLALRRWRSLRIPAAGALLGLATATGIAAVSEVVALLR